MKRKNIIVASVMIILIAGAVLFGGSFLFAKFNKSTRLSSDISKNTIFAINDQVCSSSDVILLCLNKKKLYDNLYGTDIWEKDLGNLTTKEYLVNEAVNDLAMYKNIRLLAAEKKIILSSAEKSRAERYGKEFVKQFSKSQKEKYSITESSAISLFEEKILFQKVFDSLTTTVDQEISVDEARVIKIQYIFVPAATADAKSVIDDFKSRADAGENFDKMATDNNPNAEYECQLIRGTTESAFEDAAFELSIDEISNVISTEKGYYVIKCINDYEKVATENNKQTILNNRKNAIFDQIYNDFVNTVHYELREDNVKLIDFDKSENLEYSMEDIME